MSTFLDAVNRILQIEGFIRGDTDTLTAFTDTTHNSSSTIAQIAVQQEITGLCAMQVLPYMHKTSGTITLANGTRSYALASDFVQMWGEPPFFYDPTSNFQIFLYPGGENELRNGILTYRTDPGYPLWWYPELGTTQQVSFYPVPDASVDGRALDYDYGGSVNVSASTDTIPVDTTDKYYALVDMAARRFKFLYEGRTDIPIDSDPNYRDARARLFRLINGTQPATRYGKRYVKDNFLGF